MTAFSIKLSSEANKLVHFVSKSKKDEKCSLLGVSNLWQKNQRNDNLQVCLSSLLSLIWGTDIRRKFSFSWAMMLDDGCRVGNPRLLPLVPKIPSQILERFSYIFHWTGGNEGRNEMLLWCPIKNEKRNKMLKGKTRELFAKFNSWPHPRQKRPKHVIYWVSINVIFFIKPRMCRQNLPKGWMQAHWRSPKDLQISCLLLDALSLFIHLGSILVIVTSSLSKLQTFNFENVYFVFYEALTWSAWEGAAN